MCVCVCALWGGKRLFLTLLTPDRILLQVGTLVRLLGYFVLPYTSKGGRHGGMFTEVRSGGEKRSDELLRKYVFWKSTYNSEAPNSNVVNTLVSARELLVQYPA